MVAILNNINEKLVHLPPAMPTSYISRVHHRLRTVNEKAYEPVLVSIGPYHYDKRKAELQYMEQHKLRYLDDLIKRREAKQGISKVAQLSTYLGALEELEDRARSYYAEAVTLEKTGFLEMMLLDGCFIIELFRKATWKDAKHEREMDPLLNVCWIIAIFQRDLILLENQIPFFVLERLYSIIGDIPDPLAFIFTAMNYLPTYSHLSLAQGACEHNIAKKSIATLSSRTFFELSPTFQSRKLSREKLSDFKHLLDLTRKFMLLEETLLMKDRMAFEPKQGQGALTGTTSLNARKYRYSATELRESGVRFKAVEKSKFYEITFKKGILEIPVIRIDDDTEVRFRNLIAYEEHGHCAGETFYIGDYMDFMDGLVNTPKDVEVL